MKKSLFFVDNNYVTTFLNNYIMVELISFIDYSYHALLGNAFYAVRDELVTILIVFFESGKAHMISGIRLERIKL